MSKKKLKTELSKKLKSKKRKGKSTHSKEDEDDGKKELLRWKKRSIFFYLPYWEVSIKIIFCLIDLTI